MKYKINEFCEQNQIKINKSMIARKDINKKMYLIYLIYFWECDSNNEFYRVFLESLFFLMKSSK